MRVAGVGGSNQTLWGKRGPRDFHEHADHSRSVVASELSVPASF